MGVRAKIRGTGCAWPLAVRFLAALAVFGSFTALASPNATAAPYVVNVCTAGAAGGAGDGVELMLDPGTAGFGVQQSCGTGFAAIEQTVTGAAPPTGASRWALRAPAGTIIRSLTGFREQTVWENTDIVWEVRSDDVGRLERISATVPAGPVNYAVDSDLVFAGLQCARRPCEPPLGRSFDMKIRLSNLVATLEDGLAPTVGIDPLPPTMGTVRGTVEIPFVAHDEGSGVAGVQLRVDGDLRSFVPDSNGGRCVAPFRFLVPCKLDLRASIPLRTTEFREGAHEVRVVVTDASGQTGESAPIPIDVRNAPTIVERPLLSGRASPGAALAATLGRWEGVPTSYAYQWLRCPAIVTAGEEAGCTPIAGADDSRYVPVAQDLGQRAVVKITANNDFGSGTALSAPSDLVAVAPADAVAPVLTGVSLSRKRFKVGKARTALTAAAKAPRGTVLRFSSSEAGKLSVAIAKVKAPKPIATLTRSIAAGPGKILFSGRIGKKALRSGRYRLTLSARDAAGNATKPIALPFTILRR